MYSSPQYTFLAPSGDQDATPAHPTYPPQPDRVRGPRQPSDHRHAPRLSDRSQASNQSYQHSHSYSTEARPPAVNRDSFQRQPLHHQAQPYHPPAHRDAGHQPQPARRDERQHLTGASYPPFDPMSYHGPSAYNHLSASHPSHDDRPMKPGGGGYRPLHISVPDTRFPQQQQQQQLHSAQPGRRLPWFLRPWQTAFEAPCKSNIALLLISCAAAYTLIWLVPTHITKLIEMNLYWARAIVSAATVISGLMVSVPLTEISHRMLYSAIWTAVILEEDMTLRDLDQIADRIGVISGFRLLWIKFRAGSKRVFGTTPRADQSDKASIHGSKSRIRKAIWGVEVPASLGLLLLASAFSFAADRAIKINLTLRPQTQLYDTISVGGDLSDADISAAASLQPFFDNFVRTWTLQSTAALKLPSTVKLLLPNQTDQYAYFTEVLPDNFLPQFEGYGSFTNDTHTTSNNASWQDPNISQTPDATVANRLSVLFLTRQVLSSVLSTLDVSLPSTLQMALDLNMTYGDLNKVLPAGTNAADVAIAHPFYANGVAQSFFSSPIMAEDEIQFDGSLADAYKNTPGSAGRGWVSLEVVLIRLNPELAGPGAQFGMVANVTDNNGNFGNVGYDVGVCVERFDPYIVEVYQGRSVQSISILSQAADSSSESGLLRSSLVSPGSSTNLSSLGKNAAYTVAHENARNALLKDNGRDSSWVPNPTLTSMSSGGGGGPAGYGVLDPERLADMLASADTRLLLPYLVGRGKIEARSYELKQIARVSCILPLRLPRRSTSPISWLVAFSGAGSLRIGSTPAEAIFSGKSTTGSPGDRKSASGSFASVHHLSHDPSRFSSYDDDEQKLMRGGGEGFRPRSSSDGRMLVGGAWVTLDEVEKRLGKKPVSYAAPAAPGDGGDSMAGTPWDSQPVLAYRTDF
ncbi:unnamed protein product [Tilletia laevis]|uniref:Uncharacterized protein n=1 Tax=Tilletia laevis TaxID=157183 RepID=A0A9N8QHC9_9BASI|nr:unnamed protein product [Tilletia laevis]